MSKTDFYFGILSALAVVSMHDQETTFREIVNTVDEAALIAYAKRAGEMRWSGLSKYNYGRTSAAHPAGQAAEKEVR